MDRTTSRKFVVWVAFGILTLVTMAICIILMFTTKSMSEKMIDLIEKIIGYFFGVSMLYLGVNVGQKVGLSFAERKEEKTE